MNDNELMHYGVPGMKWGKRKVRPNALQRLGYRQANSGFGKIGVAAGRKISINKSRKQENTPGTNKNQKEQTNMTAEQKAARRKKAIKVGAAVVGTALAAYGTYKVSNYLKSQAGQKATRAGMEHLKRNINTGKFIKGLPQSKTMNSKDWGKKVNRDMIRDAETANRVSNSTKEAIKYLRENRQSNMQSRNSITRTTVPKSSATMNKSMQEYMDRYNQIMNTFGPDGTDWRRKKH